MKHLIAIQSELKAPKGQYNSFGKYKYRSAEDILEAVKPICHKNDCVLTLTDMVELVGTRIYVKATARLKTPDSSFEVQAFAREPETKKGMDDSQITGTASSYARKYALNGLFCIDDTKDADTDEYRAQTTAKKSEPKPEPKMTRQEMEDKFIALCDTKGKRVSDFCKKQNASELAEVPDDKLLAGINWLQKE